MQYRDLNRMNDKGGEVGSVDGGLESSVKIEVDFRRNRSWSRLRRPIHISAKLAARVYAEYLE